MKKRLYKTGELNGLSYVKFPLRSNAILNIQNSDKFCLLWSILAYLHPRENNHPSRVRIYLQLINELNNECFDFTNGFRCSVMHRFEKSNNLSKNIFEFNFYQD